MLIIHVDILILSMVLWVKKFLQFNLEFIICTPFKISGKPFKSLNCEKKGLTFWPWQRETKKLCSLDLVWYLWSGLLNVIKRRPNFLWQLILSHPLLGSTDVDYTISTLAVCHFHRAGLGGSFGCASDWWLWGCGFDPAGSATFFRGDWS